MFDRRSVRWDFVAVTALVLCSPWVFGGSLALAQVGGNAAQGSPAALGDRPQASVIGAAQPNEHPLAPVLRWGRDSLKVAQRIQDYSAVMVKHERHNGKVADPEYMFIKVRHNPLSVYVCFLKPDHLKGQEAIWVQGQNNGKILGHGVGMRKAFGTMALDPNGLVAMQGNRYPVSEIGLRNLVQRLIEEGEKDAQFGECEVKYFPGAKLNGRTCTCIQVMHPVPRRNFLYHMARIFVDDEYNLPVRFEAYDWPSRQGGAPELLEEYTYVNIKMNNGFTDADFDTRNPAYGFKSH